MEIPAKYDPSKTEDKWYEYWMKNGFFRSVPDEREPYTIVIPPPNVTGVLHMGHMLNNTIQDILIRRARMNGYNACWLPGTDHASIATEAKVVEMLSKKGIEKSTLTREQFLQHVWEWKEKHGGIILEQLKKLGASCDWERTKFTMDETLSESVIDVFIDLYKKGYIYRGMRMIHWDPQAKTAVSDEEVIFRETNGKLFYVRYFLEGGKDSIVIATTRPETILGDTAVCVNPKDERYKHLKGKNVIIPLVDRVVPLIMDEYVDMEFGTGCLKITPAHDENDYLIGQKHHLQIIDIFNEEGALNDKAQLFVGEDRFKARTLITEQLQKAGNIVKIEDYLHKVGYSERTNAVIEPKISVQWFLRMKELAAPALGNVMNDHIRFFPQKFKNIYHYWMENIKDWCISRQLWWGHRIPVYYLKDGSFIVAKNPEEALQAMKEKTGNNQLVSQDLKQDEDVLDTWFSSWLWPISVFDGIRYPDNPDIRYYYPTNDLVTAPEIIFFWVARMIISGYEYRKEMPFRNVYFTGIVRDKSGRKMSKQLGNSPDPIDLMKKYGADGVRVGMLLCSPAGNDLLFDESLTEQGRNFGNKLWNAFRLIKGWNTDDSLAVPYHSEKAMQWFNALLNGTIKTMEDDFKKYRLSEALMNVYKLVWDEFCSWYLEIIKPAFGQPIDRTTYDTTHMFLDKIVKLLHPFMPFITEEIWQLLGERKNGDSIMISSIPEEGACDHAVTGHFEMIKEIITSVRKIRTDYNIPLKAQLSLIVHSSQGKYEKSFDPVIIKLCNLNEIISTEKKTEGAASFRVRTAEFFIPLTGTIDKNEELEKLQNEMKYNEGFLQSVNRKLNNESFVNNAPPDVIIKEKQKRSDAEEKIRVLQERINALTA